MCGSEYTPTTSRAIKILIKLLIIQKDIISFIALCTAPWSLILNSAKEYTLQFYKHYTFDH